MKPLSDVVKYRRWKLRKVEDLSKGAVCDKAQGGQVTSNK